MNALKLLMTLSCAGILLGACGGQPERMEDTDIRLAPKMSEAEKQVIAERGTDGRNVSERLVIYNTQVGAEDQVICRKEWVPGTRSTEIRCRTAAETNAQKNSDGSTDHEVRTILNCKSSGTCRNVSPLPRGY